MSTTPQGRDVRPDDLRVVDDEAPEDTPESAAGRATSGSTDLRIEDAATQGNDAELLTGKQRSDFEARWRDVQTAFVDEPQGAVDRADALVGEVVDAVTAGFSARRSQLEQRWAAEGEEAATENLRQALRAYREFFDRLLKI